MTDGPEDFIDNVKRQDSAERALQRANAAPQRPRTATNGSEVSNYVAKALSAEIDAVLAAKRGTRNDTINTAAFNLGQLVGAGVLDRRVAENEIAQAARAIGLKDKEIELLLREDGGIAAGMRKPRDMTDKGTDSAPMGYTPPPPPEAVLAFDELEQGFWTSRKSLETIYLAALSKMCAPWAVLACCAARALALVRPNIVLPDIIGGAGSLNWFGAITATSGGGKGAASATARLLVNEFVQQRNTGSGEGMITAYRRPSTDETPGLYESIMFMVDEIDSLTAQSKRNGATTMSVLRSAFSGETLGFSYVNKNTPTIESHTYRMTMIISVQPARAADLLADYHGGTPQRFMWFPGTDNRITADMAGGFVESLTLPSPSAWQYAKTVSVPAAARDLILRERVRSMQGRVGALDGHALFMREKFAFALAVLDGRDAVSEEDWELSGIAAKVSDNTRDWVMALAEEAKVTEAMEKGMLQGVSSVAADDEKEARNAVAKSRVGANIVKHLKAADQQGLADRELINKIAFRDRKWFVAAFNQLESDGFVRHDEKAGRAWLLD